MRNKALDLLLNEGLRERVFDLCKEVAASHKIISACFYGPWVCGYSDKDSDMDILLVLSDFRPRLRGYLKPLNGNSAFILGMDKEAFEQDVEKSWLGELVAEKIMYPYSPIINEGYLRIQEVKLKKRIIWELLENIVSEFPELSHELLIKETYFLYEVFQRKARLFPPIAYSFLNMLRENVKRKNVESMMRGYLEALNQLAEEDWIILSDGLVKITRSFVNTVRKRRLVPSFLRPVQKYLNIFSVFPKKILPYMHDQEIFSKIFPRTKAEELIYRLENPWNFLFLPTPTGLVPLSDKTTIEDFVRRLVPDGKILEIKELGGVLNDVYLLTFDRDSIEKKVVVKKFRDWGGFKWFPLALWAIGTKSFAVLGRSRLEREYSINRFLRSQGLPVPKVLYISLQERIIFKDFIEGENLVDIIKKVVSDEASVEEVSLIRRVGGEIAEVHKLGVTFGDCKPENIIVAKDRKPYFVDLEQATRNGNQAWDIAEFLYYSGHYVSPFSPAEAAVHISREFIEGYLKNEGNKEIVKQAGSLRYTKVFSIFTPPHIILAVSNTCKKMGVDR